MGYAEHHWTAYVEVSYKGRKLNANKFISKARFGLNATFAERRVDVRADEDGKYELERSSISSFNMPITIWLRKATGIPVAGDRRFKFKHKLCLKRDGSESTATIVVDKQLTKKAIKVEKQKLTQNHIIQQQQQQQQTFPTKTSSEPSQQKTVSFSSVVVIEQVRPEKK